MKGNLLIRRQKTKLIYNIISLNNSGRLPIEVDMNEMPDSVMKFKSLRDHSLEIPAPIPPNTIQQDNPLPVLMTELLSQRL